MKFTNSKTQTALVSRALPLRFVFVMVLAFAFAGHAFGQLTITTSSLPGGVIGTAYPLQVLGASGGTTPYGTSSSTCSPQADSSWCVTVGALPAGLTLSVDGNLSGTPTGPAGTSNFTVTVQDAVSAQATAALSIVVTNALSITTSSLPGGVVGTAYSQALGASGGTAPYGNNGSTCSPASGTRWCVIAGSLPAGLSLAPDGTVSGTPTAAGTSNFTVELTDSSSPPQVTTQALSIVVTSPLSITTSSLPGGVVGTVYSQALNASGGTAPYGAGGSTCSPASGTRWCVIAGSLPAGLSLSTTGTITGTPTAAGTSNFTVELTDSSLPPQVTTQALQIVVTGPLTITTTSLPGGVVGTVYTTQVLSAAGGTAPYGASGSTCSPASGTRWCVTAGALPAGMSLAPDGTLSGTPTAAGTSNFTVQLTDSSPIPQTTTQALQIVVTTPLSITTSSLPGGVAGTAYTSQVLSASGGTAPYGAGGSTCSPASGTRWCVIAGALPAGMTLSVTGTLSGTPTAAGTSNFTVELTDSSTPPQVTTKALSIVVSGPLSITTSSLPGGFVGAPYTPQTLSAAGGTAPYGASGSTCSPASGTRWCVISGSLPIGITLSPAGTLSGTPTVAGTSNFLVQLTDSSSPPQTAQVPLSITVSNPSPTLTIQTSSLPSGIVGTAYSQALVATGGTAPYGASGSTCSPASGTRWCVTSGSLPAGISLSVDGTLSGTPTAAGTSNFTVQLIDSSPIPQTASRSLSIVVTDALVISTSAILPQAVDRVPYFKQLDATPGLTNMAWTTISGALPTGIGLSPTTGLLSGTPTVPGTFNFTVKVDSTNPTQTTQKAFQIVVNAALSISTLANLPSATLLVDYSQTLIAAGGVQPYTWSNPGTTLPPGLSLSPAGVISGKPQGIGVYAFTVQVDDSFSPTQSVTRQFQLVVNNTLTITTTSLPSPIRNLAYAQQLQATGGTSPLTWVSNGTLPTGLTLTTSGLISGTPTVEESKSFTVTVTDSRGLSASQNYTLTVNPPVPTLSSPGFPLTIAPTQSAPVAFSMAAPFPSTLTGQLVLTFVSKAEVPGDDPMTRFSTGTRSVSFSIPANTTDAVFSSPITLMAGTVAGTVNLAADFDNGPKGMAVASTDIPSIAPKINSVVAIRTGQGLQVQVTGYAPARRVNTADFTFDVNVGGTTVHIPVQAPVGASFTAWFSSQPSLQFGSAFSYVQAFDLTGGSASDVLSVTVRLTNAQGSTASLVIPFQ